MLSAKPNQVTGGNALIAIRPAEAGGTLRARFNGVDVSNVFQTDPTDTTRVIGLVTGLANGANTFVADYGGDDESITLTNYPITGPVISGPHQTPFICQTEAFTLPDGSQPRTGARRQLLGRDPGPLPLSRHRRDDADADDGHHHRAGRCRVDYHACRRHRAVHRPGRDRHGRSRHLSDRGPAQPGDEFRAVADAARRRRGTGG